MSTREFGKIQAALVLLPDDDPDDPDEDEPDDEDPEDDEPEEDDPEEESDFGVEDEDDSDDEELEEDDSLLAGTVLLFEARLSVR